MNRCELTEASVPPLERLLGRVAGLRELDVSNNRLGDAAVQSLATALPDSLELLDVGHTHIGDDGMRAFFDERSGEEI